MNAAVNADTGSSRRTVPGSSRVRSKIIERIFRVDPAFDRMSPDRDVLLVEGQRFPGGNRNLLPDEVECR